MKVSIIMYTCTYIVCLYHITNLELNEIIELDE